MHGRTARQLARRRHRERIVGFLVVCLGVAVLVVALFALREPNGHVASAQSNSGGPSNVAQHSTGGAGKTPPKSTPVTHPTTSSHSSSHPTHAIPLVVLNNTSIHGLAQQAAQRFESGGWTITMYGDYQNDIASTCAYYDPAAPGAQAAAEALQAQYPAIKRVAPRFTPDAGAQPLPSGPVVVVLTDDYSTA